MGRNAQYRKFRRDLDKKLNHTGPSGEPNPFGNREYRRSKQGQQEILKYVEDLRKLSLQAATENKE